MAGDRHVDYAKNRRQAFRELDLIAGRYLSGDFETTDKERRPLTFLSKGQASRG